MFVQRLLHKAGDFPYKTCEVPMLETSTETANELFATIKQRDTPQTGFEKFHLAKFQGMLTPLEKGKLDELTLKLSHVKDFKVANMHELSSDVRC